MTRTTDFFANVIRNPKHPHQVNGHPGKPRKHRYQRRKIKEYLRTVDWGNDLHS